MACGFGDSHSFGSGAVPLFSKEVVPGVVVETLAVGSGVMVCRGLFKKGASVPPHRHPYEQTGYIAQGRVKATVAGRTGTLGVGSCYVVRPDEEHWVEALEESVDINTFSPIRKDYLPPEQG